uniref:MYND-type domain-containing protein n=1 Tax=Glossina brevipalpis TaxID=37001 RepID=A0A1A9VZL8_9MUSC
MSYELCSALHCNVCLAQAMFQPLINWTTEDKSNIRHCSGCQLIKYCGKLHQKIDWPFHGEFCRAIQCIKTTYNIKHPFHLSTKNGEDPETFEEMETAQIQLKYLLSDVLKRPLKFHEEELISFPNICAVCLKQKSLPHTCSQCRLQAYCSLQHLEEHSIEHGKVCHLLKLYYCPYKANEPPTNLNLKYFGRVDDLHKTNLAAAFEKVFNLKLSCEPYKTLKDYQLFSYASDFSCISSICFAMCHLNVLSMETSKLVIHVVGATVESRLWFQQIHTQFFFLQYPFFTTLELNFIGPDVLENVQEEMHYEFLSQERSVYYVCYKGLFQEYVKYFRGSPSIIVSFNCGFSEYSQLFKANPSNPRILTAENSVEAPTSSAHIDTWQGALLEMLLYFRVPIIFTSFTKQESEFDFAALQKVADTGTFQIHIDRIFKAQNPFHDLRPLRQWQTDDDESFYYRNGYIQAIYTRLKK